MCNTCVEKDFALFIFQTNIKSMKQFLLSKAHYETKNRLQKSTSIKPQDALTIQILLQCILPTD
jgi:hypothetical protein